MNITLEYKCCSFKDTILRDGLFSLEKLWICLKFSPETNTI